MSESVALLHSGSVSTSVAPVTIRRRLSCCLGSVPISGAIWGFEGLCRGHEDLSSLCYHSGPRCHRARGLLPGAMSGSVDLDQSQSVLLSVAPVTTQISEYWATQIWPRPSLAAALGKTDRALNQLPHTGEWTLHLSGQRSRAIINNGSRDMGELALTI